MLVIMWMNKPQVTIGEFFIFLVYFFIKVQNDILSFTFQKRNWKTGFEKCVHENSKSKQLESLFNFDSKHAFTTLFLPHNKVCRKILLLVYFLTF